MSLLSQGRMAWVAILFITVSPWTVVGQQLVSVGEVPGEYRAVTQEMLNDPDPEDWLMWRGSYEGWGYSPLDQINRGNVKGLQLAWSYALEPDRILQMEPVVHDGVIYIRHPNSMHTAHDAATGDLIWQYQRILDEESVGLRGITAHRGRGMFLYENKLIDHSSDGWLFALDARTGELVWEVQMTDFHRLVQPSGAPIAFNGVIVVPYNCSQGTALDPCHLSAYSAEDGKMLWRWYTTPPPGDPLSETWGTEPQTIPYEQRRNISPWMTPAVDTERGWFIFGVGSTAPMQPALAGTDGEWPDRLYNSSTIALDHQTGEVMWWAQHHTDMWNDDTVYDHMLVDLPLSPEPDESLGVNPDIEPGATRQMLVGSFGKDGIFYAYDRSDGTFLYARNTAPQNMILGYDGKTGAYRTNPEAVLNGDLDREVEVCQENRHVPQGAYSPVTGAYYIPAWATCTRLRTRSNEVTAQDGYNISTIDSYINPEVPTFGRPEAIEVSTGKTLWRLDRDAPLYGMLATGGGLLFAADTNRRFYAIDQSTGEILWQTILSGLSDMAPISYSVDGRQYVAVMSPGGTFARQHPRRLGIETPPSSGHTIFVFALPEE